MLLNLLLVGFFVYSLCPCCQFTGFVTVLWWMVVRHFRVASEWAPSSIWVMATLSGLIKTSSPQTHPPNSHFSSKEHNYVLQTFQTSLPSFFQNQSMSTFSFQLFTWVFLPHPQNENPPRAWGSQSPGWGSPAARNLGASRSPGALRIGSQPRGAERQGRSQLLLAYNRYIYIYIYNVCVMVRCLFFEKIIG